MKRSIFVAAVLLSVGLMVTFAQQPQTNEILRMKINDAEASGMIMGSELMFEGTPVKGAPYSAESASETVQTLADGNRIVQSSTSKVYRDSEGRTRRESNGQGLPGATVSFQSVAPAVVAGGDAGWVIASPRPVGQPVMLHARILISDPVAGVNYVLDPETRSAQKMNATTLSPLEPAIAAALAKAKQEMAATGRGSATINEQGRTVVLDMEHTTGERSSLVPVTESLGTETIEGLECTGTRTTMTIPAGQIGNDLPIVITSERWYSPKLQTVVLTKRHDPRTGDATFKLQGIDLSEPPASLFQVPADYTVVDMAEKMKAAIKGKEENRN